MGKQVIAMNMLDILRRPSKVEQLLLPIFVYDIIKTIVREQILMLSSAEFFYSTLEVALSTLSYIYSCVEYIIYKYYFKR